MMIKIEQKGNFSKSTNFLKNLTKSKFTKDLDKFGRKGVEALKSVTPIDTGLTASSWYYEIIEEKNSTKINFCNSNIQNGVPIAVILQYGHGTRNGGWVEGRDYIKPRRPPIFDAIANNAWKEVTKHE